MVKDFTSNYREGVSNSTGNFAKGAQKQKQ